MTIRQAAQHVIEAWDDGDLAEAINELREVLAKNDPTARRNVPPTRRRVRYHRNRKATPMSSKVTFFYVLEGKHFDTLAQAQADLDSLLSEGYRGLQIEKYAAIDGEIYSAEEGERELRFQSDMQLANERNRLIDFCPR